MKADWLPKIGSKILEYDKILIFTHIRGDGDTLGSASALCKALREQGKDAWILVEDKVPDFLEFLVENLYTTENPFDGEYVSIAVDCSDIERFPERQKDFFAGEITVNIDHHATNENFADYNYVEADSAATAELIYLLIKAMKIELSKNAAESIYAGINTDTGKYQNPNTTARSHKISAELYELGIDHLKVSIEIFESIKPEKLKLENKIINTIETFSEGKGACAYATQKMLEETGTLPEDTEGIVELMRAIKNVEVAIFLKEIHSDEIKVSMRAKEHINVSAICQEFGGGGHIKAAGCTINADIKEAKEIVVTSVSKAIKDFYESGQGFIS